MPDCQKYDGVERGRLVGGGGRGGTSGVVSNLEWRGVYT